MKSVWQGIVFVGFVILFLYLGFQLEAWTIDTLCENVLKPSVEICN